MKKIYLITRLFNFDDKLRTCKLEKYLKENFNVSIYMPYRDSDEENISKKNWKEDIFKLDIKAIDKCDIIIGYLDGPEFDEGVGFEIGYAITQLKQVIMINSDFINYKYNRTQSKNIDPLIDYLNINIIRPSTHHIKSDFCNHLKELSQELLKKINLDINHNVISLISKSKKYDKFIETGNSKMYSYLIRSNSISKRLLTNNCEDDISNIIASQKVYIVSNAQEMHFGSAIIAGLCFGLNIPFYIIDDRNIYITGMQDVLMKTNLMIDVATKGYMDIEEFIHEF